VASFTVTVPSVLVTLTVAPIALSASCVPGAIAELGIAGVKTWYKSTPCNASKFSGAVRKATVSAGSASKAEFGGAIKITQGYECK
jgi:hypothetical protein